MIDLAALIGERATRTEHLAGEDTFCLLLGKDAFVRLFSQSAPFRDFALRGVSSLLDQVNQRCGSMVGFARGSDWVAYSAADHLILQGGGRIEPAVSSISARCASGPSLSAMYSMNSEP